MLALVAMADEETKASSSSSFSSRSRKRKSCEENESSGSKSCSIDDEHDNLKSSKEKKNKTANWKLACYLANEYMTNGTLLGRRMIDQQQRQDCRNGNRSVVLEAPLPDTTKEIRKQQQKEKQGIIIYSTIMDFLRSDDLHLPGIVNPTQLAAWMGLEWIGVDSDG